MRIKSSHTIKSQRLRFGVGDLDVWPLTESTVNPQLGISSDISWYILHFGNGTSDVCLPQTVWDIHLVIYTVRASHRLAEIYMYWVKASDRLPKNNDILLDILTITVKLLLMQNCSKEKGLSSHTYHKWLQLRVVADFIGDKIDYIKNRGNPMNLWMLLVAFRFVISSNMLLYDWC